MTRLEKLREEKSFEYIKEISKGQILNGISEAFTRADFKNGFDAASTEYEKILGELELTIQVAINYLDLHYGHLNCESQYEPEIDMLITFKEAIQKLKEFRGEE